MKNTRICPKCNSTDIIRFDGTCEAYGVGNNIQIGLFQSPVLVNRYICCSCGFTEEWIDNEDLWELKNSKKAKGV